METTLSTTRQALAAPTTPVLQACATEQAAPGDCLQTVVTPIRSYKIMTK